MTGNLSDPALTLAIVSLLLIPFAAAGMCLIDVGLGRARSAAHTIFAALSIVAVAALVYGCWGLAVEGLSIAGTRSGRAAWFGFSSALLFWRNLSSDPSILIRALFELFAVAVAALIPLGSALERWRLGACAISTAFLAGVTYPLFAHWLRAGGWLAQLGARYHLGHGAVDAGGSATIHGVGGLCALALVWILGARRGKYNIDGTPAALPGHNSVFVLLGCLLALLGWLGLNGAGALLLADLKPQLLPLVMANTLFSAAAAGAAAALVTRLRFSKPDASLTANAWIAGLVAISAGAPYVAPAAAMLIGAVAGLILPFNVELLEAHLAIDDPSGAISAHALAGIWGVAAVGLLANGQTSGVSGWLFGDAGQLLAQPVVVASLLGFALPLSYGFNALLNVVYRQRVSGDGERAGIDLHELGGNAYPEFVTHTEDFGR
jgi:Amt family ammonium transporter